MYLKIIAQTGAYIKQKIIFLAVIASSLWHSLLLYSFPYPFAFSNFH